MVLKSVCVAAVCTAYLALGGVASADEYQPNEFFGLDLSKAVLSPKRLGPENQFAPVPIEADSGKPATQASVAPDATPKAVPHVTVRKTRTAQALGEKARLEKPRSEKPPGEARARLARRHSNPLDAQAFDTRIQVWPCRSGGICNWQRQ